MNVNVYNTTDYENISDWTLGQNKPNFKRGTYSLTGQCALFIMIYSKIRDYCGGDWCLVVPLVFKTSVGLIRSRVGSIPIRLRHLLRWAF